MIGLGLLLFALIRLIFQVSGPAPGYYLSSELRAKARNRGPCTMSIGHIRALRSGHAVLLGSGLWAQRIGHVSSTCGQSSDIIRHHSKFSMGRDISAAKS